MSSSSSSSSASSQVSQRIKQWLIEENDNWKFNVMDNPDMYLNLRAIANNWRIHITLDGIHDRIVLVTSMSFTKEQKMLFLLKPLAEKNQFVSDLLIALHQLDLLSHIPRSSQAKTEFILQKSYISILECLFWFFFRTYTHRFLFANSINRSVNSFFLSSLSFSYFEFRTLCHK